jgi:hypothetical protein
VGTTTLHPTHTCSTQARLAKRVTLATLFSAHVQCLLSMPWGRRTTSGSTGAGSRPTRTIHHAANLRAKRLAENVPEMLAVVEAMEHMDATLEMVWNLHEVTSFGDSILEHPDSATGALLYPYVFPAKHRVLEVAGPGLEPGTP